jgi:hypothetical protein
MHERHWLVWKDPEPFLKSLLYNHHVPAVRQFTDRKLRLFAVACCYRVLHLCTSPLSKAVVQAAEQFADGATNVDRQQLTQLQKLVLANGSWLHASEGELGFAVIREESLRAAFEVSLYAGYLSGGCEDRSRTEEERENHEPLLRDIIGNPFRPVTLDSSWLTSTVLALARGIYEEKAFDRMPILADALQDAGCDNEDILNHCRQPGDHCRGCWVLDLLLRKS